MDVRFTRSFYKHMLGNLLYPMSSHTTMLPITPIPMSPCPYSSPSLSLTLSRPLGVPVSLADMNAYDPQIHKSLHLLLENKLEVAPVLLALAQTPSWLEPALQWSLRLLTCPSATPSWHCPLPPLGFEPLCPLATLHPALTITGTLTQPPIGGPRARAHHDNREEEAPPQGLRA